MVASTAVVIGTAGAAAPLVVAAGAAVAGAAAGGGAYAAVQGDAADPADVARQAALGGVTGATAVVGGGGAIAGRSALLGGAKLTGTAAAREAGEQAAVTGAANLARPGLGQAALTGARDGVKAGAVGGAADGAVRTATERETWENGFGAGVLRVATGTTQGAAAGAAFGGVTGAGVGARPVRAATAVDPLDSVGGRLPLDGQTVTPRQLQELQDEFRARSLRTLQAREIPGLAERLRAAADNRVQVSVAGREPVQARGPGGHSGATDGPPAAAGPGGPRGPSGPSGPGLGRTGGPDEFPRLGIYRPAATHDEAGRLRQLEISGPSGTRTVAFDENGVMIRANGQRASTGERRPVLDQLDLVHSLRGHDPLRNPQDIANLTRGYNRNNPRGADGIESQFASDAVLIDITLRARTELQAGRGSLENGNYFVRFDATSDMGRVFAHQPRVPEGETPIDSRPYEALDDVVELQPVQVVVVFRDDGLLKSIYLSPT